MYRIIIVDDEKIIRDGLCSFFENGEAGFKVDAMFDDGTEAIEYLRRNIVDVVLTDIKMSNVSGLDLAHMIYEEKIPAITVLLSGYKEFEYAQLALKYGVYSYILKPVRFNELDEIFEKIREKLDEQKRDIISEKDDFIQVLINQFLLELDAGVYEDQEMILERLNALHLSHDILNLPCVHINLQREADTITVNKKWKHGKDRLDVAIFNVIRNDNISYYTLSSDKKYLNILAMPSREKLFKSPSEFTKKVTELVDVGVSSLNQMFDIEVKNLNTNHFENLIGFAERESANIKIEQISKIKQLIITGVVSNETAAFESSLESLISRLPKLGNNQADNILEDFYNVLKEVIGISQVNITDGNLQNKIENVVRYAASKPKDEMSSILFERAIVYINKNCGNDICLTDVAAYVYLSPMYFGRIFKIHTGESFTDYLINIRINNAMKLLRNGDLKVLEVGKAVGYDNIKYFIRLFKKKTGVTPGEYKKNMRGIEINEV